MIHHTLHARGLQFVCVFSLVAAGDRRSHTAWALSWANERRLNLSAWLRSSRNRVRLHYDPAELFICLIGHLFGKGSFPQRAQTPNAAESHVRRGGGRRALLALLHWLRAPLEMICCVFFPLQTLWRRHSPSLYCNCCFFTKQVSVSL